MAAFDIGIDLGTTTVKIVIEGKGVVLQEAAAIAYNEKTGKVVAVGDEAYQMLGKTPGYITAKYPLEDGAISDYEMNALMIDELLKKAGSSVMVKPRVCVSVHGEITDVERRAVIDAIVDAGARKVYLIEEPVADALGAGIDISKPNGVMIVDVGGGTTDLAILSLNGVVKRNFIKLGGQTLDQAFIRYMSERYRLLVGIHTAETFKKEYGAIFQASDDVKAKVKGRDAFSGLPRMVEVTQKEYQMATREVVIQIRAGIRELMENAPPELLGDVFTQGMYITGGGAYLRGLVPFIEQDTGLTVHVVDNPLTCAAEGTIKAFSQLEDFHGGFVDAETHRH